MLSILNRKLLDSDDNFGLYEIVNDASMTTASLVKVGNIIESKQSCFDNYKNNQDAHFKILLV